jgi:hypothetical protein
MAQRLLKRLMINHKKYLQMEPDNLLMVQKIPLKVLRKQLVLA